MSTHRFIRIHGPALIWAVLIFVLSSIPYLKPPPLGFSFQDTFAHIVEYGIFGFFLLRSFKTIFISKPQILFSVLIFGSAYGALDEIHQYFVEGRKTDLGDFLADTLGIILVLIFFIYNTVRRTSIKNSA